MRTFRSLLTGPVLLALASQSPAEFELQPIGPTADWFGKGITASGDTVIVGQPSMDQGSYYIPGAANVFVRRGTAWTQEARLMAPDGQGGDTFGYSVGASGDTVLVGAFLDDDNGTSSGSAYVFVRSGSTWSFQAKLLASDGAPHDRFGYSVSLSGDTALVGACRDEDNGPYSGSAYVFSRSGTTWTEEAKILPGDGSAYDSFGWSFSLSGDLAVIGAPSDADNGIRSGSAYVFVRAGTIWAPQAKLLASDGARDDRFGYSVSASGGGAAVGAFGDDDNGGMSGSAYAFARSGTSWWQQAKLLPSNGATSDWFGWSVGMCGDRIVAGSPRDADNGEDAGSAYVFARSGTAWIQAVKLLPSSGAIRDWFGTSVAAGDDEAIVGAPDANRSGSTHRGAAYAFDMARQEPGIPLCFGDGSGAACPCGNPGAPGEGCLNSTGSGGLLAAWGSDGALADDLVLVAAQSRPNRTGMFLQGETLIAQPFKDGLLCAGNLTERLGVILLDAAGWADSSAYSIALEGHVLPGQTRFHQLWYRDAGGPCGSGSNLTNGYRVDWQ